MTTPATTRARRHVPELDGVRGLAIVLVMALHFVNNQIVPTSMLERIAVKASNYGLWGVDLFFVLSGFLITGILADDRGRPGYFTNFFARRSLRIFPLYYGVLLILTVLVPAWALAAIDPELLDVRERSWWLWLYLTNVYLAPQATFSIPYVSHFWSLAVEEHFYLVWPVVIWWLSNQSARLACVVLGLGAFALRVYYTATAPDQLYAGVLTQCRVDALLTGAWFALVARDGAGQTRARTQQLIWLGGATVVALTLFHAVSHRGEALVLPLRTSALALFFGALIYTAAYHDGWTLLKAGLRLAWLRDLGRYSYGLYVFHGIVAYGMHRHGAAVYFGGLTPVSVVNSLAMVAFGVSLSYALARASYHGFEQPFLLLKGRFGR